MTKQDALGQAHVSRNLTQAHGFACTSAIGQRIVHGDNGTFLVCSQTVATWLTSHGYRYAY